MSMLTTMIDRLKKRLLLGAAAAGCALIALGFLTHAAHAVLTIQLGTIGASLVVAIGFLSISLLALFLAEERPNKTPADQGAEDGRQEIGLEELSSVFMAGLRASNPDYRTK